MLLCALFWLPHVWTSGFRAVGVQELLAVGGGSSGPLLPFPSILFSLLLGSVSLENALLSASRGSRSRRGLCSAQDSPADLLLPRDGVPLLS